MRVDQGMDYSDLDSVCRTCVLALRKERAGGQRSSEMECVVAESLALGNIVRLLPGESLGQRPGKSNQYNF